jgi:3',5'-cyclic AMP phosphodiesterase CpdA/CheY-like chemotaxis protein
MQYTILVCDDKKTILTMYREELEKIPDVKVLGVDRPQLALELLAVRPDVALLIMDLNFPTEENKERFETVGHLYLPEIREAYPRLKIVVATKLDSALAYNIVLDCTRKRLQDDWIDLGKGIAHDELRARIEMLLFPRGSVSRNGLWILQVSDLHFGHTHRYPLDGLAEDGALLTAMEEDFSRQLKADLEQPFPGLDLILVGGDMTHTARDAEYDKAESFLRGISAHIRNLSKGIPPTSRVIAIPGNHDVNWDISRARSLTEKSATNGRKEGGNGGGGKKKAWQYASYETEQEIPEHLRYLGNYLWAPFARFLDRLKPSQPKLNAGWNMDSRFRGAAWAFPDLGVAVVGLNSSVQGVSHIENKPVLEGDILTSFPKQLTEANLPADLLRICLVHHSIGSEGSGSERVSNADIGTLREILSTRFGCSIVLTGHVHKETCEVLDVGNSNILLIGSGSTSVESSHTPPTEPLHYNLINVTKSPSGEPVVVVYPRLLISQKFGAKAGRIALRYRWGQHGWIREQSAKASMPVNAKS